MAVLNSYNYSKPKNYVNVNIGQKAAPQMNSGNAPGAANASNTMKEADYYLEQKVMSAKPEELTYMLYEGLVRFIKKAIMALETNEIVKIHNHTLKAQKIVNELRSTLNMEIEISSNLDSLYEYLEFKLVQANIEKDRQPFEEALEIAEELKDAWRTAFRLD